MAGGGTFDESLHPRADDGKFGAGSGGGKKSGAAKKASAAGAPGAVPTAPAKASAAGKTALTAAREKAKGKAAQIIASAKAKAAQVTWKGKLDVAKQTVALKAGKVADPKAAKAKIAAARVAAKEKAAKIVAAAKERAKATIAKAKVSATKAKAKGVVAGAKERAKAAPKSAAAKKPAATAKPQAAPAADKSSPNGNPGKPDLASAFADRSQIANGVSYNKNGIPELSPSTQAAMRGHFNDVINKYGIGQRDLPQGKAISVVDAKDMAGAQAQFNDSGVIRFQPYTVSRLVEHARSGNLDALRQGKQYDGDTVNAYHLALHESLHGSGPYIPYEGHGILADEVATEVVARHMSASVNGIKSTYAGLVDRQGKNRACYGPEVRAVADAISRFSGKSTSQAFKSLENASFSLKRMDPKSGFSNGADALHHLVERAADHAGIKDPAGRAGLHAAVQRVSDDLRGDMA